MSDREIMNAKSGKTEKVSPKYWNVPFVDEVQEFNDTMGKPNNYEPTVGEKKEWQFVYDFILEELQEMCDKALNTETQVVVKREDEMALAELNGSYLKFVEDAARLLYEQLHADQRIKDFRIICSHQESLHSHDAISVILAPNSKFCGDVSHETWSSLIHIS